MKMQNDVMNFFSFLFYFEDVKEIEFLLSLPLGSETNQFRDDLVGEISEGNGYKLK